MTGPALRGTDAAPADGGSRGAGLPRSPRLRIALGLARIEALLMVRSILVLAGLLAGVLAVWGWFWFNPMQPLWWWADWRIGVAELILAMTVLVAAQLAAGRARRDAMADLYASFPATAGTRTLACLAGLAGAVPASVLLAGAAAGLVQLRGAIGAPGIMVLAGGVVLVIAAGAAGTALGSRFPHPLAGLLGALALFLPTATAHLLPGWSIWLIPWHFFPDQLGWLPGPLTGYPPAGAHAAELAGAAILAAIAALAMTVRNTRARGLLAAAGILAMAAIFVAGAAQLEPVPAAELNHLAAEMADPGSVQHCTTASQVRYCLYPGFGRDLSSIEAPVNEVLALLPARPSQPLTVRQVLSVDFTDPSLTRGQPQQQVSQWTAQTRNAPGNITAASAIYLDVGEWPTRGGWLTYADFNLALAAADWAVGFTPASQRGLCRTSYFQDQRSWGLQVRAMGQDHRQGVLHNPQNLPYVPGDQAREAIAIWLAILATHPPAGERQHGVQRAQFSLQRGRPASAAIWSQPGQGIGGVTAPASQQSLPAAVYLLAKAMTGLPEQKVSQVLKDRWATWLNGRTTDAQLAAALGIQVPGGPLPPYPKP
jgi:hypothetical protein